jgi:hypothetical protein
MRQLPNIGSAEPQCLGSHEGMLLEEAFVKD